MSPTRTAPPTCWLISGDDHEHRLVEAPSLEVALERVCESFAQQYDEPYSRDLLQPLAGFTGPAEDPDELSHVPIPGSDLSERDALHLARDAELI